MGDCSVALPGQVRDKPRRWLYGRRWKGRWAILIDGADRRVVAMPSPTEFYALWSVTNNDRLVPN